MISGRTTRRKNAPARLPQQACRLDGRTRQLGQGRARHEVDVGVEHEREQDDGTGERAHVGQAPAVVPGGPHPELHRPAVLEEVGVGIGDHVGRHRQRQHQHPGERAATGEAVALDAPGAAHAENDGAGERACREDAGNPDRFRQHCSGQVGERLRIEGADRGEDERGERNQQERADDQHHAAGVAWRSGGGGHAGAPAGAHARVPALMPVSAPALMPAPGRTARSAFDPLHSTLWLPTR